MADDSAKWREASAIYSALDSPVRNRIAQLYGDLASTRSKRPDYHHSIVADADDLIQATKIVLDEQNIEAAKAHQADIVKDYEDALAGADIMREIEGK